MATMHHFPDQPFQLPFLIRRQRVVSPPSTYQPPYRRFQPVVLAYPATMFAPIGPLAMSVLLALEPGITDHAPPAMAFAPFSLAVLQ